MNECISNGNTICLLKHIWPLNLDIQARLTTLFDFSLPCLRESFSMAFISLFLIFSSKLVCLVTSYGKLHLQKSCFFLKTLFSDMYGLYLYWNLTTGRLVYKYGHIHCFPLSIKSIQFIFYYLLVFFSQPKINPLKF